MKHHPYFYVVLTCVFLIVIVLFLGGSTSESSSGVDEHDGASSQPQSIIVEPKPIERVSDSTSPPPPPPQAPTFTSNKYTYGPLPKEDVFRLPRVNPQSCPTRYLHTNTHTYGRHHNQLQEFVNALALARRIGRTLVVGYFRHNHKWVHPHELYNLSRWKEYYCVLYPEEFVHIVRTRQANNEKRFTGDCYGQELQATPIGKQTHIKCKFRHGVPKHFDTRHGARIAVVEHYGAIASSPADFLNLSGQFAFFIRPELWELALIFALLQPRDDIRTEAERFRQKVFGASSYPAVHLRYREGACEREMHEAAEDFNVTSEIDKATLLHQCLMKPTYVKQQAEGGGMVFFLASDHQNMDMEKELVQRLPAVLYNGKYPTRELGGLQGLTVDFYLLTHAEMFVMNQVSSISQNVCYTRLGLGLRCQGVIPKVLLGYTNSFRFLKSA